MKTKIKSIVVSLVLISFFLSSCGSSNSTSSSSHRSVNHYHHGHPRYLANPYYGRDVIIIDDGIDVDEPIAVPYNEED
ncbi:hypothetical protein LCM02_00240 [Lutimonas saemankumensis]|uniref:hypothetical protein n=1 Tax=Lutimonas saemankumensis TaxID=483016 RepID=UPI001CD6F498|nr:hypothetical protein [Lutimonas saemankumensis]MCA0930855.1 hypothetical protein [Lutimonas saemankumensis]